MSACTPPGPAAFESGAARGVTPPLLPTLAMAVILGAASYLCHEPVAVAPPASVPATALAAAPETTVEMSFIPAPLAFQTQFPLVMMAEAEPAAQIHRPAPRPARIAVPRRTENPRVATVKATQAADKTSQGIAKAPQGIEKAPQVFERALPFAAEAEVSRAAAATDEGVLPGIGLPDVALPFAPTIRAVTRAGAAAGAFVSDKSAAAGAFVSDKGAAAGAFVGEKGAALGAETATLGAAVTGWVGRLR